VEPVTPWETASGGRAAACPGTHTCAASYRFSGTDGMYTIAVLYFDESDGQSEYRMFVGEREIGHWRASGDLPSSTPNGHTATRRLVGPAQIRSGETIRVEATPDGGERAVLDYVEITAARTPP
jgi:alpha-glucuronidase